MVHQGILNFNLKQFLRMWIFLIVVVILVWQCSPTVLTFLKGRTTIAITKSISESLELPTLVLCQEQQWNNGYFEKKGTKIADKDWFFGQFLRVNDQMNISSNRAKGNFFIGTNDFGTEVRELLSPWHGLCYSITPSNSFQASSAMDSAGPLIARNFSKKKHIRLICKLELFLCAVIMPKCIKKELVQYRMTSSTYNL